MLVLWVLVGLINILPYQIQVPAGLGLVAGASLFTLGLILERRTKKVNGTAKTPAIVPNTDRQVPNGHIVLSATERRIQQAIRRKERADRERIEEQTIFAQLAAKPAEECFVGAKPIEITFEDLGRLPTLVLAAIEESLDHVPKIPPEAIAKRRMPDTYHVRADGPRYDIRTLRSVRP